MATATQSRKTRAVPNDGNAGKTENELNEERRKAEQKRLAEERAKEIADAEARGQDPDDADYEPLLEIETVAPKRPFVHIDGQRHELRLYREFGIAEQQRLRQDVAKFDALWKKPALTNKEGKELKVVLDRLYDKVLIAPTKIKTAVDDEARLDVVMTFQNAPLLQAMRKEQAALAENDEGENDPILDPEIPAI